MRSFRANLLAAAMLVPLCDGAAAQVQPPGSSIILKIYETEADKATRGADGAPRRLNLSGYRRQDIIGHIYEEKFFLVPATGLDNMRYYAQAVADLTTKCPELNLESAKYEILPYIFSGAADLFSRFQQGKLTQSEVLQAGWMAILGMNQHWACTYNPSGSVSREQAQASCNEAGRDTRSAGVLPSFDAAYDMTLFVGRHSCKSPEARRLARQLIAFGRMSHSRTVFTERMPSPASPEGKAYSDIFENCTRTGLDTATRDWCACYVRTLHSLKPPGDMVNSLARNPFVDGTTYMSSVAGTLTGGSALYKCADQVGRMAWRDSYAPRPTACLIKEAPLSVSGQECHYRSAWGEFTIKADKCEPEISSRRWGYREVDCAKGGVVAAALAGPRVWKQGIFTSIDYEGALPAGFVPPLPEDAVDKLPLQVRYLQNKSVGMLARMSLAWMTRSTLYEMGMDDAFIDGPGQAAIRAIHEERPIVLTCVYRADAGAYRLPFWYARAPKYLQDGQAAAAAKSRLDRVKVASICPARYP